MGIIENIKNIKLEEIFWQIQFGRSKKRGSAYDLRASQFQELPNPVFFLSTGRSGTAWFSKLMEIDKSLKVIHNPFPNLAVQSKIVYEVLSSKKIDLQKEELIGEIYLAARENHLRYSFKSDRRLVETNNGISFFAPILSEIFPNAKFVHLVRNPYEFIQSGLKRGYYTGTSDDIKRLNGKNDLDGWEVASRITKIAWLWHKTNKFIKEFSDTHPKQIVLFPFQNLKTNNVQKICSFLEINISNDRISQLIRTPINVQKKGESKKINDWGEEQKKIVRNMCDSLAVELGIQL